MDASFAQIRQPKLKYFVKTEVVLRWLDRLPDSVEDWVGKVNSLHHTIAQRTVTAMRNGGGPFRCRKIQALEEALRNDAHLIKEYPSELKELDLIDWSRPPESNRSTVKAPQQKEAIIHGLLASHKSEGVSLLLAQSRAEYTRGHVTESLRLTIRCPARVHPMELDGEAWVEQAAIMATAHSLSKSGLGFLSQQSIKPGQYVRIHLLGSGSLANKSFEGQVVRCRNYTDGNNEVGMAFTSLDGEQRVVESEVKASSA